ncbi:MAG: SMI1/KNR4 family protein [Acidobacteria bacterium]|nr:SMI1/KNR4 family protein [Acidobacteriota bacterium]MBS1866262.1 SMI1/KNR4 family protein [Acidobacteriota bacterium]
MTTILDLRQIQRDLSELRERKALVFGSEGHRFKLNPPLDEKGIRDFERDHGVSLPQDYRYFLSSIGNGGAGPFYGIFSLGKMDGLAGKTVSWREGDGLIGSLRSPFPLRESWNDLTELRALEGLSVDSTEFERELEKYEAAHWDSSRMNGALPISHMGCALRVWLVVTGDEAGFLWRDGRADDSGISPLLLRDGSKARFASWYLEWLSDALIGVEEK